MAYLARRIDEVGRYFLALESMLGSFGRSSGALGPVLERCLKELDTFLQEPNQLEESRRDVNLQGGLCLRLQELELRDHNERVLAAACTGFPGFSLWHIAAHNGNLALAELAKALKCETAPWRESDVACYALLDHAGWSPLMLASSRHDHRLVRALLEAEADPTARFQRVGGRTALHTALLRPGQESDRIAVLDEILSRSGTSGPSNAAVTSISKADDSMAAWGEDMLRFKDERSGTVRCALGAHINRAQQTTLQAVDFQLEKPISPQRPSQTFYPVGLRGMQGWCIDPGLRLEDDYDLRLSTHRLQRSITCPEEAAEFASEAREEFQVAW
eukprot:Skav223834  [mRNA]  locus=scaffold1256:152453:158256:- [translate_table: standard]